MSLQAPPEEPEGDTPLDTVENEIDAILKEVKVDLQDDPEIDVEGDDQTKKDFANKKKKEKENEMGIPEVEAGDTTGRNQSFDTFRLVQSYFSDAYLDLDNDADKKMFKDWCMYNLDLLLKNYEEQLASQPEEPNIENPEGV